MDQLILVLALMQEPRQYRAVLPPKPTPAAAAPRTPRPQADRLPPEEAAALSAALDRYIAEGRPLPDLRRDGAVIR